MSHLRYCPDCKESYECVCLEVDPDTSSHELSCGRSYADDGYTKCDQLNDEEAEAPETEPEPDLCDECDGTGIRRFCPAVPDKCGGCEEAPCEACNGSGGPDGKPTAPVYHWFDDCSNGGGPRQLRAGSRGQLNCPTCVRELKDVLGEDR